MSETDAAVDLVPQVNKAKPRRIIDLDAARASRYENLGEPPIIKFQGKEWILPLEMSAAIFDSFAALEKGDAKLVSPLFKSLVGIENYKAMLKLGLSVDDMMVFIETFEEVYGISLPESEASVSS